MDDQSPPDTARMSFFYRFSSARRRELAQALIAEIDAEDAANLPSPGGFAPQLRRQARRLAEWSAR